MTAIPLHYTASGSGPPLVILHGLLGSSENWKTMAERLSSRFTVYVPDLRNHGRSPHDGDISYSALAGDILRFFDDRKLKKAAVLGHSMGGKAAMAAALAFPERLGCLIVADMTPAAQKPRLLDALEALASLDTPALRNRAQADKLLSGVIRDRNTRLFLLKNLKHSPAGGFTWLANIPVLAKNYPALCEGIGRNGGNTAGRYGGPVLFLKGETSGYLSEDQMVDIKKLFPQAVLREIPGAGHWVHADNPDVFLNEVSQFLNSAPPWNGD